MFQKSSESYLSLINTNKREKTKFGYYVNSFQRFGDDLCEFVLSYFQSKTKVSRTKSGTNNGRHWSSINKKFS